MAQAALKGENSNFDELIKKYLAEAKSRLGTEFIGTREAIRQISEEKVSEYIDFTDRYMEKSEIELLNGVFAAGMYQAFCYGYGIGKVEGSTNKKIFL